MRYFSFNFRIDYHESEIVQQKKEHHIEVQQQQHVEVQKHHGMDENDGHPQSNHTHPKLDLKNFHTQLW